MRVTIDPSCDILYSSFYVKGLRRLFGRRVRFGNSPFKDIRFRMDILAFIVQDDHFTKRVIIDFGNGADLHQPSLDWCDVYGKVNLDIRDADLEKVVAIGPLMAIKIYNWPQAVLESILNYFKGYGRIKGYKWHFGNYKSLLRRPRLQDYEGFKARENYIFFASSIWKNEPVINAWRASFIRACRGIGTLRFEGGFAPRRKRDIVGFEDLTMQERCSTKEFSAKTGHSAVVFNTPSIEGCNGWKLAEYLIMGKAVLTTEIIRLMPGDFTPGKQVLYTSGSEEDIRAKLVQLLNDNEMRTRLEHEARAYYDRELAPEKVILRLLGHLGVQPAGGRLTEIQKP